MKAIQYTEFGPASVLRLVDLDIPKPAEGELLIKVTAAGVNPVDTKIRKGLLTSRVPAIFPVIPGWDFSGEVVECGFGARRFQVGDKVMGYARRPVIQHGTYAEYITLPECYVTTAPGNILLKHAAAIPLAALTAYQSMYTFGRLQKGESVVILGASGGVGSFAVQMAAATGATVIAVASEKNHEYLKQLGAQFTLDYHSASLTNNLKKIIGNGADLAFDCVGDDTFVQAFGMVSDNGRVVSILINQPDKYLRPNAQTEYHYCFVEPHSANLEHIASMVTDGSIKINIDSEYPLSEAIAAHEKVERLHTRGKIILEAQY